MQKIRLRKQYTRDTSLIIQQLFPEMAEIEFAKVGWINPHGIPSVHHMASGVTQVWENEPFYTWLMNKLLEKNHNGSEFFDEQTNEFVENKKYLTDLWNKGSVSSPEDLLDGLGHIRKTMFGFCVMYWSGLDSRTPQDIKEKTLMLRKEDSFWDQNDQFIRTSLRTMYPQIEGYEVAVLKQEITAPPSLSELKKRLEGFTIGATDFAELGTLEEFINRHPEYEFIIEKGSVNSSTNTIIGSVANKGHAQGVVRILKKVDDVVKVQDGDIIVSPMTTPNYIIAMGKAAAFVTDEGGVLCHAAIIAREMKKPCIVGTGNGTQILKDGDVVNVDAEKGIVTKLNE